MLAEKTCMFESVPNLYLGVDVIIVDCLKNLLVLGLFSLPDEVPKWNVDPNEKALQVACIFALWH